MAEPSRTPPFLLEHFYVWIKILRTATALERPSLASVARVAVSLRAHLVETRPNQRVNVPLDHLLQLLWARYRRLPPT
jgi:hypothetical protein